MKQGLLLIETPRKRKPAPLAVPTLLITLEPWRRTFFRNLWDLFRVEQRPPLRLVSRPGAFWPDVFVSSYLPWGRFLQSSLGHILIIVALVGWSRLWPQRTQIVRHPVFHSSDVVYYEASEYLAPLNTGGTHNRVQKRGDPAYAPQPIISVPPEADNRTQTVVAPPKLKLNRDVPLPNIVAWARPQPTIPLAATASSVSDVRLPVLPTAVIAPAPEVDAAISRRNVSAPQAAIVEPPPQVENAGSRRLTDINVGRAQVVAPAPQLPMEEQRALVNMSSIGASAAVVPPPPSFQTSGTSRNGRMIALNARPAAPDGPMPAGNRRGTFAATPEGKAGGAGTPDMVADNHRATSSGVGSGSNANGVPPGLFVGASPKPTNSVAGAGALPNSRPFDNSRLLASATMPRVSSVPRGSELPANAVSELERRVFGGRKSYSMNLNVPNLNSAGGSWVMHFAELKEGETQSALVAPVATQAVDPGYPLELMRQNVQGTVTLSAVIRSDGSVGDVRILRGVDDRLDAYATAALSRWRFKPATKNGEPVALQAVVIIPFRLRKTGF
jgi:TonB family protein